MDYGQKMGQGGQLGGNAGLIGCYEGQTKALPPHDAAANSWAAARQRLLNARAGAAMATEELENATRAEREAWERLEMEAERGPQIPCSPSLPPGYPKGR
jgi:hypothetical protein